MILGSTVSKIVVIICLVTKASAVRVGAFRSVGKDDVIFQKGLTFESLPRSKIGCAIRCSARDECLHFTWVNSSPGICRGHSFGLDDSEFIAAPGAKTYTLTGKQCKSATTAWLNKACTVNCQCPAVQSECFKGQCLCTPGYYYSISQNNCTATCNESNLQSTFLRYPGAGIKGHNTFYALSSHDQCLGYCLSESSCRAVDYNSVFGECFGHGVTPLQVTLTPTAIYDFYQRTCA